MRLFPKSHSDFIRGVIALGLALSLVLAGLTAINFKNARALTKQDQDTMLAFREQFQVPEGERVSANRWQGQTVYLFSYEGRSILLAAGQWVEIKAPEPLQ